MPVKNKGREFFNSCLAYIKLQCRMGKLPTLQLYRSKNKADKIIYSSEKTTANQIKGAFQIIKAILIRDATISCTV